MVLNGTISPKTTLASLPAEVLVLVLTYSQEANLIHTCRHFWNSLPSFVSWTKALCAIALCFTKIEHEEWAEHSPFETTMKAYRSDISLALSTPLELDSLRATVFTACWFRKSHLQKTMAALCEHTERQHVRMAGNCRCSERIYNGSQLPKMLSRRNVTLRLYRLPAHGLIIAISHGHGYGYGHGRTPVVFSVWHSDANVVTPTTIIAVNATQERYAARPMDSLHVACLLGPTTGGGPGHSKEDAQDAMTHYILQDKSEGLLETMRYRSEPHEGAQWKHVVLAAHLGRKKALKLLLHRPMWPAWDTNDLGQLAEKVKESKREGLAEVHRLLMYEWRMQRSLERFQHLKVRA